MRFPISLITFVGVWFVTCVASGRGQADVAPDSHVARDTNQTAAEEGLAEAEEVEEIEDLEMLEELPGRAEFDSANLPRVERGINLLTARTTPPGSLLFVIDHRNYKSFAEDAWHDYVGFDGGNLKIGLGLRYGILEGLDLGLYRLNGTSEVFDSYEFDVRWLFLEQAQHQVDLALRAGVTSFVYPPDTYAAGYLGQLLANRVFAERLMLGLGVLFHSDSSNDEKSTTDTNWSLAFQAMAELRLLAWLAWDFEICLNAFGYGSKWPIFATSVKILTHRHTFSILLSNNQYMGADGVVSNTWRALDELILGFQITRQFDF